MQDKECTCEQQWAEFNQTLEKNRGKRSALIAVLHKAQELFGYIPRDVQIRIAEELDVPLADVYGVVTFYNFFSLKPQGKYKISVCKGTSCYVRGAPGVIGRFSRTLGIEPGDSTDDGQFSIEVVRCLGACGLSPVITVNKDIYALVKEESVPEILTKYSDLEDQGGETDLPHREEK